MPRTASIVLREHLEDDLLLQIARTMPRSALFRAPGFLEGPPDEEEDEELALFGDHDLRASDRGTWVQPEEECRSRRVDLRGPTDRDPGPLAMEPAEEEDDPQPIELDFRPR